MAALAGMLLFAWGCASPTETAEAVTRVPAARFAELLARDAVLPAAIGQMRAAAAPKP
jgi:hypothetical protein